MTAQRRRDDAALTIAAIIEQRAGEPGRWEWEPDVDAVVFRHDMEPMPVDYGCSTELINPADNELLDVFIIGRGRARGERVSARVYDVLQRADGDDKLLAVPAGVPPPSLDAARDAIWAWSLRLGKPVLRWGGEDAALALIESCRAATTGGARP